MKHRVFITACLVILLGNLASTVAQENRYDLSLEGPWILYVDRNLAAWPVLIAIAPNTHSVTNWQHDPPLVSSGDAYLLGDFNNQNQQVGHIYCLMLDSTCAPQGTKVLQFHDYPDFVQLLPVQKQPKWSWVNTTIQQNATAFILPMPDSYSSDGVWPMRFAEKFDLNHTGYGRNESHMIGIQLHYSSGPVYFDLDLCDGGILGKCQPVSSVEIGHHTLLANNGTLRIYMKGPVIDWACDPHVRRIYPRMLDIVGQNANPKVKVIDPAHLVKDDGTGAYDEDFPVDINNKPTYQCLAHDSQIGEQQCDATHCDDAPIPMTGKPPSSYSSWLGNLRDLRDAIAPLDDDQKKSYYLGNIADASKDLAFPRISQIDSIEILIAKSYEKLKKVDAKGVFEKAFTSEKKLIDSGAPTKSGNDCKAPLMLVQ